MMARYCVVLTSAGRPTLYVIDGVGLSPDVTGATAFRHAHAIWSARNVRANAPAFHLTHYTVRVQRADTLEQA